MDRCVLHVETVVGDSKKQFFVQVEDTEVVRTDRKCRVTDRYLVEGLSANRSQMNFLVSFEE